MFFGRLQMVVNPGAQKISMRSLDCRLPFQPIERFTFFQDNTSQQYENKLPDGLMFQLTSEVLGQVTKHLFSVTRLAYVLTHANSNDYICLMKIWPQHMNSLLKSFILV